VSILRSLGYPNRVVALLTPIVAPLAGLFASFLADRVPGIPKDALNEIFIAGAILVLAPALQFMHGRLKWDLQQDQHQALALATAGAPAAVPTDEQFAEIGIAPPAEEMPADEDADEDLDLAVDEAGEADETDDGEDASSDILAEVGDLLDDEEELDGLPETSPATPAGS
jgi:hypothetical protein